MPYESWEFLLVLSDSIKVFEQQDLSFKVQLSCLSMPKRAAAYCSVSRLAAV